MPGVPSPVPTVFMLKGSGIDWLSVSAKWEAESLRLSPADLKQLAGSTGRFVKLPDSGWVEHDPEELLSNLRD